MGPHEPVGEGLALGAVDFVSEKLFLEFPFSRDVVGGRMRVPRQRAAGRGAAFEEGGCEDAERSDGSDIS